MQSSNPVFRRNDSFNGRSGNAYGNPTYPGAAGHTGYGQTATDPSGPSGWSVGAPTQTSNDRITIDSVVQKTGITLLAVVVAAAVTWFVIGDLFTADGFVDDGAFRTAQTLSIGGALIGFGLAMVNSFKKVINPALVLAYAVVEGVFVGALSKMLGAYAGDNGIVAGAVLGTVAAFAGTLTAYKVFNIQVGARFRKIVIASVLGFVAVSFLDFILSFFGAEVGFNGLGGFGLITSIIGVVLGVFMLILDFDYVEKAIAAGAPERESWRAAFGLTVTLVWIYIEMLRILAILRGD